MKVASGNTFLSSASFITNISELIKSTSALLFPHFSMSWSSFSQETKYLRCTPVSLRSVFSSPSSCQASTKSELNSLTHRLSQCVAGFLEREGLLVREDDNDYLALDGLERSDVANSRVFNNLPYRYRQTARTKGLYLANHCTYGRAGVCVRL